MSTGLPITLCRNLKPFKNTWKIEVKILHTWKQFAKSSGEMMEIILADVEGTKIQATMKKVHMQRHEKYIVKGEWKIIQNFSLYPVTGHYRTTEHTYRMVFTKDTFVTPSNLTLPSYFLNFADYGLIHAGKMNESFLYIIGQVINLGELETKDVGGKATKKLDLQLRDEKDERIGCTLWGTLAEEMKQACQTDKVIFILRWAKIKEYKDVKSVSSAYDASVFYINENCPEVQSFVAGLPNDGLTVSCSNIQAEMVKKQKKVDDYWANQPRTRIDQLREFSELGKARIICTVNAIDTDWSWYYIACLKKTTEKYKIHLQVSDDSGQTKIMLFDSVAQEILKHSANQLLNGELDEIEDPENVPAVVKTLIGRTFQFVCEVRKENLNKGLDQYKVVKVMSEQGMIEESNTIEDSEKPSNQSEVISHVEELLSIEHNNEESENDIVTPTSKRKTTDDEDTIRHDQSSSTKQIILKKVKIEKMDKHNTATKKE